MSNLIKISNTEIQVKEYQGERVCTFKDIDAVHQRPARTASRNFSRNKKHFIEGEDYFHLLPEEIQCTEFAHCSYPKGLNLVTESGYMMLVKSFTDDLAWDVQRQLVKNYFRKPEPEPAPKTKRQELEEKYLEALKYADEAAEYKTKFYNQYVENEKLYRGALKHEKEWKNLVAFYRGEIKKHKEAEFLEVCAKATKMFPVEI